MRRLCLALCLAGLTVLGAMPEVMAQNACTHYASPGGGGDGLSQGSPFHIGDFWGVAQPGHTLCLLDGTYTGGGNLIAPPNGFGGASGAPITIRALHDGAVLLDGEFHNNTLYLVNTTWLQIEGIDVGNSAQEALALYNSHHIIVRRVCAWNAQKPEQAGGGGHNLMTSGLVDSHDNLFEDLCAFGYGRNVFSDFNPGTHDNTFRRLWLRWDGWPDANGGTCPGGTVQGSYHTSGASIYENVITIFSGGMYDRSWPHPDGMPCGSLGSGNSFRDGVVGVPGYTMRGLIDYGYRANADIVTPGSPSGWFARWVPNSWADVFTDSQHLTTQSVGPTLGCDKQFTWDPDYQYEGNHCEMGSWDRITSLKNAGQDGPYVPAPTTNLAVCTALQDCPNFYTGSGAGKQGSRACQRYQDGTLTQTPLWPWPMDSRIKQALQRSGIGPTLQGEAGPGYEANTVTSEIVSRYGPLPTDCKGEVVATKPKLPAPKNFRIIRR